MYNIHQMLLLPHITTLHMIRESLSQQTFSKFMGSEFFVVPVRLFPQMLELTVERVLTKFQNLDFEVPVLRNHTKIGPNTTDASK